ncbi:MAG: ATP-binding cassette domain-containing protein [Planctomycetes bacterium]|nr:ABC transporter ATP-binding protein [Phycisphaerae bacterium]NBB95210.1 ATP-binding cassette domain-containing protein [Planctomycetota bacterium]
MIDIRNLTKRYGDLTAVNDLSFQVLAGEVFALLGPNGAGKTTTIRTLIGILQPTDGKASIHGLLCGPQRPEIMRRVGYLPDEPTFYDYLRGREIIEFVGEMHGLDAETVARRAGPLLQRLELDDALGDYAVNFSHGMKKKLAFVAAVLHEPSLLILDEPTNGLDPYATRALHGIIGEHARAGGSVLLSTHLLDQAERLASRVGILYRGQLAACGPLAELRRDAAAGGTLEEIFFRVTGDAAPAAEDGGEVDPA